MSTATTYRNSLYTGSKKWKCPGCGQNTLVLYIDRETTEFFPSHVGRCDREHRCSYHYTPKQFYAENGEKQAYKPFIEVKSEDPVPVDFMPMEYLSRCVGSKYHPYNNFYKFLVSLFGKDVAVKVISKYALGTSSYWKGAAVFPQVDQDGNLRQIKIMLHDPHTGKRVKKGATVERWDKSGKCYVTEVTEDHCSRIYGKYINESTRKLNLEQTFFGCHLLTEYPDKDVCVVESEKTAMIASVYLPQFVWLATGGASGCKWREYATYKAFKGRSVTLFPDYGYYSKQKGITCYMEWCSRAERIREALGSTTKIQVSDLLERRLRDREREDQDLADLLINRDKSTGIALTEAGYPVIRDFKNH